MKLKAKARRQVTVMILEAILCTINSSSQPNFAPIGVHVSDNRVMLRLYSGSNTYANLRQNKQGVICFSDDVLVFVETALFSSCPPYVPSVRVAPPTMANAGTVWETLVYGFDETVEPAIILAEVVYSQENGSSFTGFCRAKMAVLEAAIAATRCHLAPELLMKYWNHWLVIVEKTGGTQEFQAFDRIHAYLKNKGMVLPTVAKELWHA